MTRREVLRGGLLGAIAAALPAAAAWERTAPAQALALAPADATLQAFFDTVVPGRRVARTVSGAVVHPGAIAGADPDPGAVEADALALAQHPRIGFDALAPASLADLELRAAEQGGPFLALAFDARTRACVQGLDFGNPLRTVWEAAAAVAFTAFCGGAISRTQTRADAPGWAVMGLPGRAPHGYPDASYGRRLARERTRKGYLA
ncbi:MAG: hypothetical protein HZB46_05990 [Solirubrobacterales bacterium]|nr:hypothetical protein [Solirubrobacterales bacterium]